MVAITKQVATMRGGHELTAESLARIDKEVMGMHRAHHEDDLMSEFSVITNETEIAP